MDRLAAFEPTGIYWKSDPLRIPEAADTVAGVPDICDRALADPNWFTIGEDKRMLADVAPADGAAATWLFDNAQLDRAVDRRHEFVLKPSNLTRGAGIVRGRDCRPAKWEQVLSMALSGPGSYVLQEACDMRAVTFGDISYHGDLSAYVINGELAGFMSRASLEPVVNIGRNSFLQTVWGRA